MTRKTKPNKVAAVNPKSLHFFKEGAKAFSKELKSDPKAELNIIKGLKYYQKVRRKFNESPFCFNGPVEGSHFLNNRKELKDISEQLLKPGVVFVSAHSGFGNTSFAYALRENLRKISSAKVVYSDVAYCHTEVEFMNSYIRDVSDALGHTVPYQTIAYGTHHDKADIVQFPQKLATKYRKKIILILDNFDCIQAMPKAMEFVNFLIQAWAQHKSISVCVFTKAYDQYLSDSDSDLYDPEMFRTLQAIPEKTWHDYLLKKFRKENRTIDEKAAAYLVSKMNKVPRDIQRLAHDLFITQSPKITINFINNNINTIVDKNGPWYSLRLKRLTKLQRQVLYGYVNDVFVKVPKHLINSTLDALDGLTYRFGSIPKLIDPFLQIYMERDKPKRSKPNIPDRSIISEGRLMSKSKSEAIRKAKFTSGKDEKVNRMMANIDMTAFKLDVEKQRKLARKRIKETLEKSSNKVTPVRPMPKSMEKAIKNSPYFIRAHEEAKKILSKTKLPDFILAKNKVRKRKASKKKGSLRHL